MRRRTTDLAAIRSHSGDSKTPRELPSDVTVGEFISLLDSDEFEVWTACRSLVARIAARAEHRADRCDDQIQETMLRMHEDDYRILRRADPSAPLVAWVRRVMRHLRLESTRHDRLREVAQRRAARREAVNPNGRVADTFDGRSILDRAYRSLPAPFREIICWRWESGAARSSIAAALRSWGGIGPDEARRLQREAERMLQCLAVGVDPREVWPRRFAKKNRWAHTPRDIPESHRDAPDEQAIAGRS